jgi:hypothetical protein
MNNKSVTREGIIKTAACYMIIRKLMCDFSVTAYKRLGLRKNPGFTKPCAIYNKLIDLDVSAGLYTAADRYRDSETDLGDLTYIFRESLEIPHTFVPKKFRHELLVEVTKILLDLLGEVQLLIKENEKAMLKSGECK